MKNVVSVLAVLFMAGCYQEGGGTSSGGPPVNITQIPVSGPAVGAPVVAGDDNQPQ